MSGHDRPEQAVTFKRNGRSRWAGICNWNAGLYIGAISAAQSISKHNPRYLMAYHCDLLRGTPLCFSMAKDFSLDACPDGPILVLLSFDHQIHQIPASCRTDGKGKSSHVSFDLSRNLPEIAIRGNTGFDGEVLSLIIMATRENGSSILRKMDFSLKGASKAIGFASQNIPSVGGVLQ